MDFLEKDLEEILIGNLKTVDGRNELFKRGLDFLPYKLTDTLDREFDTKQPVFLQNQLRIGNYGKADIVIAFKKKNSQDDFDEQYINIYVIELKKSEVNIDALLQVIRYRKGIERYLESRGAFEDFFVSIKPIIIGRSIDKNSDWIYLQQYHQAAEVYSYDYDINGITFWKKHFSYQLTNEGF